MRLVPPIPAHSGWRGALPRPAGWLTGSLLVIAARPILPSITDKDNVPYDPLLVGGALTILLSVAAASLAAVLTTRYPAGVPARECARTPMDSGALRPGSRRHRRRPGLPGRRTHLLHRRRHGGRGLGRGRTHPNRGRSATHGTPGRQEPQRTHPLRAFARDPRRPVSAIVIGSVSLALTVGILGTLSSVTAQDHATYIGNRHLDQVEALLYSGSDPRTVEQALAGVLPAGTPIAKGTYPVDEKLLKASPSPALTPSWSIAWLAARPTTGSRDCCMIG
ncbi:hypothetical protein ACFUGD_03660 [Streptomyces sp. NPDC057217]|uniref:hypothetical protein n=1 Tax=Streptomyces sp. NPDC057217 TaxID=3346054 RepID=UPI0036308FF5